MTLDKHELLVRYPDADWRSRYLEVTGLVGLLHDSIIDVSYKPSDDLNAAIALTPAGEKLMLHLQRREAVPVKEARLLCLLITAHTEPLVDVERIDVDRLAGAIAQEVAAGALRYPYIYGRGLYDRFATQHQEERRYLNLDETLRLLDDQPIGIYQERQWLLGPYGLLRSSEYRHLPVGRWLPLRHCADPTCDIVHEVSLESSDEAPINKFRTNAHKHLEKSEPRGWQWGSFARSISATESASYDDLNTGTLPFLLGDCLALSELRLLFCALLDSASGLRKQLEPLGLRGNAEGLAEGLDQSRLLQLVLLLPDHVIISALDACVQASKIQVPRSEVRRPIINAGRRSGAWGAQLELGSRGTRVATRNRGVSALRLQRLISELYGVEVASAAEDLDWLLREIDGPSLEARLAEFLRTTTPADVVLRLIAMRKDKVVGTAEHLRFALPTSSSDGEVVEHVLWRLALDADAPSDPHASYWRQHEALEQRLTTAAVSPLLDEEAIRSVAANYFVALEGLLDDALHFATWVFTHDHFTSQRPFVFRPQLGRRHSTDYLNLLAKSVPEQPPDYTEERASLYSLCIGFKLLSDDLRASAQRAEELTRPEAERPDYFEFTPLQAFPFHHTLPYLDLQPEAKLRVCTTLDEVGRILLDSRISEIRNQQLHFRRSRADSDRFVDCLRAAREAVHMLEVNGLARLEFGPVRTEVDQWGRSSVHFRDKRGKEVTFARPSRFAWCGLPELNEKQYLVTSSTFAEPNEMLRFLLEEESLFADAYDEFPRRPKLRERAVPGAGDTVD